MINFIMSVIFNLSDGNATGWFHYAIQPFAYVLGGVDMFCTFLILLVSGLTYIGSDHNTFTTSLVLLISSLIFSTVLVSVMSMFIAVIAGLIVTFLLYKTFVERKVNQ